MINKDAITNGEKVNGWISIIVFLICIFSLLLLISNASANITYWGLPNYSEMVLPNNSYVHQGEVIEQGYYYDISGVYGWSGILGHWKNDNDVGYTLPDNTVNLNDLNPRRVYIDPTVWKVGHWYQIDSYNTDSDKFFKGNNYVFYVLKAGGSAQSSSSSSLVKTVTTASNSYTSTAYVWDGNTSTRVDVTMIVSANPTAIPSNLQTVIIPVTTTVAPPTIPPTPEMVTPRAPLPMCIPLFALFGVLLWYRH